jgi:PilZ domain-containing protein
MREEGSEVPTWASFTDISMHGCYIEIMTTYPVGTVLEMKLEANGFQVIAKGTVRICYAGLGMGIAFGEMSEDNRTHLRALLKTIARPTVVMGPAIASSLPSGAMDSVPLISDPGAALRALVQYFNERQMLLRPEFLQILRKSQPQEPPQP